MKRTRLDAAQLAASPDEHLRQVLERFRRTKRRRSRPPVEVAPGVYEIFTDRDWSAETKSVTSKATSEVYEYALDFEPERKEWTVLYGDKLIATWQEASLPGLADWIFRLLTLYRVLALEKREQARAAQKGGKRPRRNTAGPKIRLFLVSHPNAVPEEVAQRFGSSVSYVYKISRDISKG